MFLIYMENKANVNVKGGYPFFYDESILTCARPRNHPRTYTDRLIINPNSLEPQYFSDDPLVVEPDSLIAYMSPISVLNEKSKVEHASKRDTKRKTLKKSRKVRKSHKSKSKSKKLLKNSQKNSK